MHWTIAITSIAPTRIVSTLFPYGCERGGTDHWSKTVASRPGVINRPGAAPVRLSIVDNDELICIRACTKVVPFSNNWIVNASEPNAAFAAQYLEANLI